MGNIPSTMMSNAMIIIKYALLFIFIYVCFVGFNNLSEYKSQIDSCRFADSSHPV